MTFYDFRDHIAGDSEDAMILRCQLTAEGYRNVEFLEAVAP